MKKVKKGALPRKIAKKSGQKKIKVLGVIPTRLNSQRLPGKMLADVCGKPLIQRTYEQVKKAISLDALVIATDSKEIAQAARGFGARVIMTSSKHQTGTDRVSEAVKKFTSFTPDIVVNLWGDCPLISMEEIEGVVMLLKKYPDIHAAGAASVITKMKEVRSPSVLKVVVDPHMNALHFSRSPIPYVRRTDVPVTYYQSRGIWAFRRPILFKYVALPRSPLELVEEVEQLRFMENGYKMKMVCGHFPGVDVNVQQELDAVRRIVQRQVEQGELN